MPQKFRVAITSKRNYDRLMSAYQKKGWVWRDGTKPKSEPFIRSGYIDFHNFFGRCLYFDSCPGELACAGYTTISFAEAMRRLRGKKTTKTTTKKSLHPDIGKRVVAVDLWGEKIKGILLAVDCDEEGHEPHLIKRLDNGGWPGVLLYLSSEADDKKAIGQGVGEKEDHLWWVQSYVLDTKKAKKKTTKPKLHPWLGKRVLLFMGGEKILGILAATNIEGESFNHYIIREDGRGWRLRHFTRELRKIERQGVIKTGREKMWGFDDIKKIKLLK